MEYCDDVLHYETPEVTYGVWRCQLMPGHNGDHWVHVKAEAQLRKGFTTDKPGNPVPVVITWPRR